MEGSFAGRPPTQKLIVEIYASCSSCRGVNSGTTLRFLSLVCYNRMSRGHLHDPLVLRDRFCVADVYSCRLGFARHGALMNEEVSFARDPGGEKIFKFVFTPRS